MSPSLLLPWSNPIVNISYKHICNGVEYFDVVKIEPEISYIYNIIFKESSRMKNLVKSRMVSPYAYYDADTHLWKLMFTSEWKTADELTILGWRFT